MVTLATGLRSDGQVVVGVDGVSIPSLMPGISGVVRVSRYGGHTLALRADGTVWAWGSNIVGQLGNGTTIDSASPVQVSGLTGMVEIAAGNGHSLALKDDGTVWAWGYNANGQIGDGTTFNRYVPVLVAGLSNVIAIAAGTSGSVAIKSDHTVWEWGSPSGSSTPIQKAGLSGVNAVATGFGYVLALKADGTVWGWGNNVYGQLGDGTNASRTTPVQMVGITNAVAIAVNNASSWILKQDGTVWATGENASGKLGDGTAANRYAPVQVIGITGVSAIAAQLALKPDGSVYHWGPGLVTQVAGIGGAGYLDLGVTDPANFAPQTDVPLSSVRTSNAITVNGIINGAAISVAGGSYSIGCTASFTSSAGTIDNGQTVCVRQTSAASCGSTTVTTLMIDGLPQKTFSVTTSVCDTTPDPFFFTTQANVPPGTLITSNAATITGINGSTPIDIANGEYSVGCTATFTSAASTINNGQTVCVRQVSSPTPDTLTTAVLTVGTGSVPFSVITTDPAFATTPMISLGTGLRSDGQVVVGVDGVSIPSLMPGISGVVRVSRYGGHTLALRADGTVWAWGSNIVGQLGNGTTIDSASPVQVSGLTGMVEIAAGNGHSLALKDDGTVWAWGYNANGQIGDGTTFNRYVPVLVAGLSNVIAIAAGTSGSVAIKSDHTVWEWGSPSGSSTPIQKAGLSGVNAVATGFGYVLALKADGTVWGWGNNVYGQLGDGTNASRTTPVQMVGITNAVAIAVNNASSWILKQDGTVWATGENASGKLGDGTTANRYAPVQVIGITGVSAIAAQLALKPDGSVYHWGPGLATQVVGLLSDGFLTLLLNNQTPRPFSFLSQLGTVPSQLALSNDVIVLGLGSAAISPIEVTGGEYSVNGGPFTSVAGTVVNGDSVVVRVMSSSSFSTTTSAALTIGGASGRSSTFYVRTRNDPSAARVVPQVAAGDSHTLLLTSDGTVYAAGYNGNGQLGNGTTLGLSVLRPVAGLAGAVSIASGAFHGLALRADGTVAAWGSNAAGQLGHNSTNNSERYFVDVTGLSSVAEITAGTYHSVAVRNDGTVWAWGLNAEGQVGDGSIVPVRLAPVQVTGLAGVTAIAAGGRHTLALLADGTLRAWGANDSGQLGDGTTTQRNAPVPVSGLSNVIAIAAGDAHSLALKNDGSVVAWGFNAFGQLGVGDTANRLVPTAVTSLGTGVGLIAAGANHSLAVKVGGALYSWGNNANSQLGNGNNTNQTSPVLLASPSLVTAIAGGSRHSAAITADRKLHVWGDNFFGQVGNRSGNYSPHSASLNVLRGDSLISTGADGSGGGIGTGSNSGSSILEIDGQATGFNFGSLTTGALTAAPGKYKNASPTEDITGISIGVTGPSFALQSTDCPATLAPDQECNFSIGFNPGSATTFYGELVVSSSVVGSPERRSLLGAGIAPAVAAIAFAKTGLDFPPQTVGASTAAATYALANTGSATLVVSSVTSTLADFSATHNCASVVPGAGCSLSVTFTPTQAGSRVAYLTVNSNASANPHTVTVSGTGVATITPNYTLTVARAGAGSGTSTVSSNVGGISCGATCAASFSAGTVVTLTATPGAGALFAGWTNCPAPAANQCTVTVNAASTVTANFTALDPARPDFNADGKPDIIWSNTANGATYVWRMNGPALISDSFYALIDPSWKIQGVADFNGDGHPDIVWRNTANGSCYVWYTVNGVFTGNGCLSLQPAARVGDPGGRGLQPGWQARLPDAKRELRQRLRLVLQRQRGDRRPVPLLDRPELEGRGRGRHQSGRAARSALPQHRSPGSLSRGTRSTPRAC